MLHIQIRNPIRSQQSHRRLKLFGKNWQKECMLAWVEQRTRWYGAHCNPTYFRKSVQRLRRRLQRDPRGEHARCLRLLHLDIRL